MKVIMCKDIQTYLYELECYEQQRFINAVDKHTVENNEYELPGNAVILNVDRIEDITNFVQSAIKSGFDIAVRKQVLNGSCPN